MSRKQLRREGLMKRETEQLLKNRFNFPIGESFDIDSLSCVVCGGFDDNKIEPRFGYSVCKKHENMSPVEISNIDTITARK